MREDRTRNFKGKKNTKKKLLLHQLTLNNSKERAKLSNNSLGKQSKSFGGPLTWSNVNHSKGSLGVRVVSVTTVQIVREVSTDIEKERKNVYLSPNSGKGKILIYPRKKMSYK